MAMAQSTAEARWAAAYAQHWNDVFRFALAWTNDWGSAEDLAQDVFIRLWQHRARLDWSVPILPWLLRVTRNAAGDRFRAMRRLIGRPAVAVSLKDGDREAWMDIRNALERLTRLERSSLVSTTILGFSTRETADALGISDGAVRSAISRARQKLEVER